MDYTSVCTAISGSGVATMHNDNAMGSDITYYS